MSFEQAYEDMVTAAEAALAAWPGVPIVMDVDNRLVINWETERKPVVVIELHLMDGQQLSIGQTKEMSDIGQIHVIASNPENAGSKVLHQILDHFRTYFEMSDSFSAIRTFASLQGARFTDRGRFCLPLVTPFRMYRLVTS